MAIDNEALLRIEKLLSALVKNQLSSKYETLVNSPELRKLYRKTGEATVK